jgi:hypothetical protein
LQQALGKHRRNDRVLGAVPGQRRELRCRWLVTSTAQVPGGTATSGGSAVLVARVPRPA